MTPVPAIIRNRRRGIEGNGFRLFCLGSSICSCALTVEGLVQTIADYTSFRADCQNP